MTARLLALWPLLSTGCSDDGLAPVGDTDAASAGNTSGMSGNTGQNGGSTGGENGSGGDETTAPGDSTGGDPTGPSDTGGPPPGLCEEPSDCVLINDCCQCAAAHVIEPPEECPVECKVPVCDELGIPDIGLVCEAGECRLEKRNCATGLITCDGVPPECPEQTLPEITPEGDCWTGACIPLDLCEAFPSCEYCDEGEGCVELVTLAGSVFQCRGIPGEPCPMGLTCECLLDVCPEPYDQCVDGKDHIECSCTDC